MSKEKEPDLWREKKRRGDTVIMKHGITGEERTHTYTEQEKRAIKDGALLQPNIHKDKFIEKYGHHPNEDPKDVERFLFQRGQNKITKNPIHKKYY